MPAQPPEFRRRTLDLVAEGGPVVEVAKNLGISESCRPRRPSRRTREPAPRRRLINLPTRAAHAGQSPTNARFAPQLDTIRTGAQALPSARV